MDFEDPLRSIESDTTEDLDNEYPIPATASKRKASKHTISKDKARKRRQSSYTNDRSRSISPTTNDNGRSIPNTTNDIGRSILNPTNGRSILNTTNDIGRSIPDTTNDDGRSILNTINDDNPSMPDNASEEKAGGRTATCIPFSLSKECLESVFNERFVSQVETWLFDEALPLNRWLRPWVGQDVSNSAIINQLAPPQAPCLVLEFMKVRRALTITCLNCGNNHKMLLYRPLLVLLASRKISLQQYRDYAVRIGEPRKSSKTHQNVSFEPVKVFWICGNHNVRDADLTCLTPGHMTVCAKSDIPSRKACQEKLSRSFMQQDTSVNGCSVSCKHKPRCHWYPAYPDPETHTAQQQAVANKTKKLCEIPCDYCNTTSANYKDMRTHLIAKHPLTD